jgi:uncharacterized protein YukE
MAQLGADVEALDTTANSMTTSASQIEAIASQLTSQLQAVWWKGADRERFVAEWESRHRKALTDAGQAIVLAANAAKQQAEAQRQASA